MPPSKTDATMQEPMMNTRHTLRATSFLMALMTTVVIFSNVAGLAAPSHAGTGLAQLQTSAQRS
jgi:predicted membrane protein